MLGRPPGQPSISPRRIPHLKTTSGETALKLFEVDVRPSPKRKQDLREFALALREAGMKGSVEVLFIVDKAGQVQNWKVRESKFNEYGRQIGLQPATNPVLKKVAADCFKQEYTPGMKDGELVPVEMGYYLYLIGPKTAKAIQYHEPTIEDADVPPKRIKYVPAKYPKRAMGKGIKGTVWVRFILTEKGEMKKITAGSTEKARTSEGIEIIHSLSEPGFRRATLQAARQWKYTPAMKDGKPFTVKMVERIDFVPPKSK
jgi:outer membrane biosynthesis protein TonB